jgi:hypothetical protein
MKDNYKGKKTNIPYVDVPGEVEAAPDGLYPWLKGLSLLPRTAEFNIERPSIDFISERANYGSVTQTKAVTFTFDLRNAKPLSSAYIRFTANGDAVSFSNFAQMNGSLDFNAGVGELNIIFFFYDGTTAWYYIPHGTAPTGGGSVTANHGNTVYVSADGNDGTGVVGNISKPFLTAQAGLASMNAAIPGTIIILSSTGAQSIGDKRYLDGDAPERLSIQDLCACGITFIGEISLGEVFIDTNEIISINTDTSCVFAFLHAHCAQFLIPDTMAGTLVAASSSIDCNIFVIEDNANASVVLDVITWTTGAAIGVIDAFSYNDCTAWEYDTTLNQTSTNAPVAGVINKNTLNETLTFGYVNPGDYTINSPGNKFTLGYTVVTFGAGPYDGLAIATVGLITAISVGTIEFGVYSPNAFKLDDNLLLDTAVNIKIYPLKY